MTLNIKKAILEAIYDKEANVANLFNAGGIFDSNRNNSVSGMDARVDAAIVMIDNDAIKSACEINCGPIDEDTTIDLSYESAIDAVRTCDKELYRILIENSAKAAAWSLGDRTKIPFIMCEAESFRPSVQYADVNSVQSRIVPGGVQIMIPNSDAIDISIVNRLAENAVISSFMMHDVDVEEQLKAGKKSEAAAKALAFSALAEYIVDQATGEEESYSQLAKEAKTRAEETLEKAVIATTTMDAERLIRRDYPQLAGAGEVSVIMNKNLNTSILDMFGGSYNNINTIAIAEAFQRGKVRDVGDVSDELYNFKDLTKNPEKEGKPDTFWADIGVEKTANMMTFREAIKNLAAALDIAERLHKEKKGESGSGEGEGEGQSPADAILSLFHSDAGAGQGDPQQQQQQQQQQQSGSDPTKEERVAKLGRFGSTIDGARFNELLAGVDWHSACLDESPVDWTDFLNGALLRATGIDRTYTWSRPSRRHASMGIYVPGFKRRRCKRLALCIDESGSIDMPKLEKFNEEIIRVIDTVNPEGVDVIHFSTEVAEETLVQGEVWEAKRMLNGGTRFQVAFKAIAEHMAGGQQYDAIVFFTDMEDSGYWGLSRANVAGVLPDMPDMFWVAYGGNTHMPDFGTYIDMDSGKMADFN